MENGNGNLNEVKLAGPLHASNGDSVVLLGDLWRRILTRECPALTTETNHTEQMISILNQLLEVVHVDLRISNVINKTTLDQSLSKSRILLLHSLRQLDHSSL